MALAPTRVPVGLLVLLACLVLSARGQVDVMNGPGTNLDMVVEGSWGADYSNLYHRDWHPSLSTMRLRATCSVAETGVEFECDLPVQNRSLLAPTGLTVGFARHKNMRDGCTPLPKDKKRVHVAIVKNGDNRLEKCDLSTKAANARAAGYRALIVSGARRIQRYADIDAEAAAVAAAAAEEEEEE